MKYSQKKNKNEFIKGRWGGPNFEGGFGVPLLNLGVPDPTFKLWEGSRVPLLNIEGGPRVPRSRVLVPFLHHAPKKVGYF